MALPIQLKVSMVARHPDGQNAINVLRFTVQNDTTTQPPGWNTLAELVYQALKTQYASQMSSQAELIGCYVNDSANPVPLSGKSSGAPTPGGVAEDIVASQLCCHITHNPASATWTRKGRTYYPFLPVTAIDTDGSLDPTYSAAVKMIFDTGISAPSIIGMGGGATLIFSLYSATKGASFIETNAAHAYPATQRRRSGLNSGDAPF